MGCHLKSSKSSYYKFMKKQLKKSFDNILSSEFNRNYSIQLKKFEEEKKKKRLINDEGDIIDWKSYLLDKLSIKDISNWKKNIYEDIINTAINSNFQIYLLENEIFTQQFFLLNFPLFYLKDSEKFKDPVLFLFNPEELKPVYNSSLQELRSRKNTQEEIELGNISFKDNKYVDDIDCNKEKIEVVKNLKFSPNSIMINDELSLENYVLDDERKLLKYNTYKIREHINLIRKQLENKGHPISKIIKKFSEFCSNKLKYEIGRNKNDKEKIESFKEDIVKEIQNFIEIVSVALKLFYSKTINYEFFISERDEFLNLICFFLFNEKTFYNNLFELFQLSNTKRTDDFLKKKEELKVVTPKDSGISVKFRLNNETKQLKNNTIDVQKNKKPKISEFFEKIEEFRNRANTYSTEEGKNLGEKSISPESGRFSFDMKASTLNKIYANKLKVKKERNLTVTSFKEFSEQINDDNQTIREKFEMELSENPSNLDFPSISEIQSKFPKFKDIPYGEAIKYMESIKDYNAPLDKLTIIALTSVLIIHSIDDFWKDVENLDKKFLNIDADELMSIYLYIVYNIDIKSIYTQLDFIKYFTGSITKQSMIGYYYTTVNGCLSFIMEAKTKEDFTTNLNQ